MISARRSPGDRQSSVSGLEGASGIMDSVVPADPTLSATNVVRSLWHGSPLSVFEELSLRSFLHCGHAVELYTYEEVEAPPGVRVCDANTILPESHVFAYASGPAKGSFAAFSNLFRFKMLAEHGGIWSDADMLCLKPLDELPEAWAGQVCKFTPGYLNTAILKFPPGHEVCADVYRALAAEGVNLSLGSTGELLTQAVRRRPELCESLPVDHFYPFTWRETWLLVDPDQYETCSARLASSYGVHCWNTAITFGLGMPKNALPPAGSYLHQMASVVLEPDDVPTWPIDVARVWIDNFNKVQDSIAEIRIGSNVIGRIEKAAVNGDGVIEVAGWAFDQTRPWEPVTIMFLRDGAIVHAQRTAGVRPDVTGAYPSHRPRYVMFQGAVKPELPKPPRSFASRLLAALRGDPALTVLAIGPSGSASVIGNVSAGRPRFGRAGP